MEIKELTITTSATANFQKMEVAITATNLNNGDIEVLQDMTIKNAVSGLKKLLKENNAKSTDDIKTETTVMKPVYKKPEAPLPANTYYRKPEQPQYEKKQYNGVPGSNTSDNHPASKTQLEMLQRLGYTGDTTTLTSKQAFDIIKQLRGY